MSSFWSCAEQLEAVGRRIGCLLDDGGHREARSGAPATAMAAVSM